MARGRNRMCALAAVPENEIIAEDETGQEVLDLINSIEAQLEERIASIISAANDAVNNLRNDLKARMVRLPKQTKEMTLKDIQEKFPDDFKTGALMEIRQRYAAMAEAAQNMPPPQTNAKGRKRTAEPMTVMQTVKTRRTAAVTAPSWGTNNPSTISATVVPPTVTAKAARVSTAATRAPEHPAAARPSKHAFNGLPLQTPMPFAGEVVSVPVTMVAQKRGGRTKAVPAPQAAVITTADGMQWALGKEGTAAIPESHRAEVEEMLSAQFDFIAAALGKTVFGRHGGRGGKKRG